MWIQKGIIATEIYAYPASTGPLVVGNKYYDTDTYGGYLTAECKIASVWLVGGVGIECVQNDDWKNKAGYMDGNYRRVSYFVALGYPFNKFLQIHPGLSYFDHGDDPETGDYQGNKWMLGLHFRFVF